MIREKIKHSSTRSRKSYASLRLTMLANLLLAIVVALALFFLSKMLFDSYIDKKYLSEDSKTARINGYRDALQNYVTENNLDCDDTA